MLALADIDTLGPAVETAELFLQRPRSTLGLAFGEGDEYVKNKRQCVTSLRELPNMGPAVRHEFARAMRPIASTMSVAHSGGSSRSCLTSSSTLENTVNLVAGSLNRQGWPVLHRSGPFRRARPPPQEVK